MATPSKLPATGAVLAGGRSTRMGRDKASMPWKGAPLGVFVAERLAGWFEDVLVSADRPGPFASTSFRVVPDIVTGAGALGGLHGVLSAAKTDWTFLAACDMPHLREGLVRFLWGCREGADVVVPEGDRGLEPLCAFYSIASLVHVSRALEAGERRVVSFFPRVRVSVVKRAQWEPWDPEGLSFHNVNTPEEYERSLGEP